MQKKSQIEWACRRGMLELDILLQRFMANGYEALTTEQKALFYELLNAPDPDLFAWLMAYGLHPDPSLQQLIELIRKYAIARI